MTTLDRPATRTHDEDQVRQLIADQLAAIAAKDLDRLIPLYAADAVMYDVKPPYQTAGAAAWRAMWEQCLPYFPDGCRLETRDLHVHVGGELATAHWLFRITDVPADHPAGQTWMRSTAAYRKLRGRWVIAHEHASVPFDPLTGRAAFTLDP
jgi:uncharacterized protein (TIGR02246 family)